jgi:hypothetical protein
MARHTGGVTGFEYQRATCPRCQRKISGGRMVEREGCWIVLRKHKITGTHPGRPWCAGSRTAAEVRR